MENNPSKTEDSKNVSSKKSISSYINKDNQKVVIIVAVVLLFGIGALFNSLSNKATQSVSEKIIENAINSNSDTKVDLNNGSLTYTDKNGATGTYDSKKTVSDDFPSEIPLYASQEIIGNIRNVTAEGVGWLVSADTSDSTAQVNQFFKDNLVGWTQVTDYTVNDTVSASYTKGKLQFSLVIAAGTATTPTTGITYSVTQAN